MKYSFLLSCGRRPVVKCTSISNKFQYNELDARGQAAAAVSERQALQQQQGTKNAFRRRERGRAPPSEWNGMRKTIEGLGWDHTNQIPVGRDLASLSFHFGILIKVVRRRRWTVRPFNGDSIPRGDDGVWWGGRQKIEQQQHRGVEEEGKKERNYDHHQGILLLVSHMVGY